MRGHKMTKSVAPRLWLCAIATAVLAPLLAVAVASHTTPPALADAVTGGTGSARDGWVNNQPSLSPTQVTSTMFGQLYSTALDGQVYAQPVTYDNTVVVATENDTVAGINESDGVVEWSRHLGIPWNTADVGCSDISPTTGITGTPVVEPNTGTVYLVTKSYVSGDGGDTQFEMHALDVLTGLERPDWPVVISGSAANDTNSVFAPEHLIQRPALLLMNGVVYAAFGGFCDTYPYQGWIAGVSTANAAITTLWTTEPATGAGSIWQSGSGLASDGPGQILFATGNGTTPPSEAGQTQPPPTTLGQSIVRVGVHPDGSIATTDFYAPADAPDLNPDDLDLGSGGVSLLPDQMGTASDPHLLVQGGKSGELYLLNRDDLGGRGQGPGGADAAVDEFGNNGGIWSTPAAWPGDGGWLYDPTTGSPGNVEDGGGKLYAYQESVDATGAPTFSTAGSTSDAFPYGSSSAVVSSDGTTSGSALVWIVYMNGSASELRAYLPVPVGGMLQEVWSAPVGTASKFEPPTIDGGKILLGTNDGHLLAFGPSDESDPVSAPDVSFGSVEDGATAQATVTLTASRAVTITGVHTSDPQYTSGLPGSALPATIEAGGELAIPISFTPDRPGQTVASLVVDGSDGSVSSVSLSGTGVVPPNAPMPSVSDLSFGVLQNGSTPVTLPVTFTNDSAQAVTITGELDPSVPVFSTSGLPPAGTVVNPDDSVTAQVTFDPPATTGSYADLLGLTTDQGTASVGLTAATTAGSPQLAVSSQTLAFGAVDRSTTSQRTVLVSNTGTTNLSVQMSGLPSGGFSLVDPPQVEPITVFPHQTITLEVQFAPQGIGSSSASLDLVGNDGRGSHVVELTGSGISAGTIPDPQDGGWTLNGQAIQQGAELQLTDPTGTFEVGSAFWPVPTNSRDLAVNFTSDIGGGSGADGLTLALTDPSAGPTALGGTGGGLGFAGIPGVAVGLDTYPRDQVGIVQSQSDGTTDWLTEVPSPVALRQGTHQIDVTVSEGVLSVSIDGTPVTSAAVSLTPQVLVGFTAGDGVLNDRHAVGDVAVSTDTDPPGGANPVPPHFYDGNVEGIRGAGSATTLSLMQRAGDLYTGAGLYGCTLNDTPGQTAYNTNDQTLANGTANLESYCQSNQNADTTDVNDNWDRVEVTQGVDDPGSSVAQGQLCGTVSSPLPVDFVRSSAPAGTACATLDQTGYAKDSVPIISYPINPATFGTTSPSGVYSSINGGDVGPTPSGWLPGDPTNGPYSGSRITDIDNNDNGATAGVGTSTAYRLWCASDTATGQASRITDWGQLTNLGGTTGGLEIQGVVLNGDTATVPNDPSTGTLPPNIAANQPITGPDIPTGTTILSISGSVLTLSQSATNNTTDAVRVLTGVGAVHKLAVGQGMPVGIPIRLMGVDTTSGTEGTFTQFANEGASTLTGCGSDMNGNDASDPNPGTATGEDASPHVALENNSSDLGRFAQEDFPHTDYTDQAIEISTTLYVMSYGVWNTSPYAAAAVVHDTAFTGVALNENGVVVSARSELDNEYPTSRTLFNIYDASTVRGPTGGFLNWICDPNTNFNKGTDSTTGVNFDTELGNIISTVFGFPRLTDQTEAATQGTPADGQAAPTDSCQAALQVYTTAGSTQITLASGDRFPVDIRNQGGLVDSSAQPYPTNQSGTPEASDPADTVVVASANTPSADYVVSGSGTNALTLAQPATVSTTSEQPVVMTFGGVPAVTSVAPPQS